MNKSSINDASKEQLIDLVRSLKKQLKDAKTTDRQPNDAGVKELQSQITGFQGVLQEKNDEIQALRMQGTMLSEKSAADEATISTLFKKVEDLQRTGGASASPTATPVLTAKPSTVIVPDISKKISVSRSDAGSELLPPTQTKVGRSGRGTSTDTLDSAQEHATVVASLNSQLASSSAALNGKNEEIAKLESTVRELMEVNSFYSAIVSQHDEEELHRKGGELKKKKGRKNHCVEPDDAAHAHETAEVRELLKRAHVLEDQHNTLQRVVRQVKKEKDTLVNENSQLRQEVETLEANLFEMERWQRTDNAQCVEKRASPGHVRDAAAKEITERKSPFPERVPATVLSTSAIFTPSGHGRCATADRRQLNISPLASNPLLGGTRTGFASATAWGNGDATADGSSGRTMATLNEIRALRPIRIRNPDAQEKELLRRLTLFEKYFNDAEAFETDRRKSFDEMERTRAELFTRMNDQIETQRRKIYELSKCVETSVPAEGAELAGTLSNSTEVKDEATAPLLVASITVDETAACALAECNQTLAVKRESDDASDMLTPEEEMKQYLIAEERSRSAIEQCAGDELSQLCATAYRQVCCLSAAAAVPSEFVCKEEARQVVTAREYAGAFGDGVAAEDGALRESAAGDLTLPCDETERAACLQKLWDSKLNTVAELFMFLYGKSLSHLATSMHAESLPEEELESETDDSLQEQLTAVRAVLHVAADDVRSSKRTSSTVISRSTDQNYTVIPPPEECSTAAAACGTEQECEPLVGPSCSDTQLARDVDGFGNVSNMPEHLPLGSAHTNSRSSSGTDGGDDSECPQPGYRGACPTQAEGDVFANDEDKSDSGHTENSRRCAVIVLQGAEISLNRDDETEERVPAKGINLSAAVSAVAVDERAAEFFRQDQSSDADGQGQSGQERANAQLPEGNVGNPDFTLELYEESEEDEELTDEHKDDAHYSPEEVTAEEAEMLGQLEAALGYSSGPVLQAADLDECGSTPSETAANASELGAVIKDDVDNLNEGQPPCEPTQRDGSNATDSTSEGAQAEASLESVGRCSATGGDGRRPLSAGLTVDIGAATQLLSNAVGEQAENNAGQDRFAYTDLLPAVNPGSPYGYNEVISDSTGSLCKQDSSAAHREPHETAQPQTQMPVEEPRVMGPSASSHTQELQSYSSHPTFAASPSTVRGAVPVAAATVSRKDTSSSDDDDDFHADFNPFS